MKLLVQIALAGSLTALSLGFARAQDTFDFENQAANIGLSIAASPTVAAEAPSARTLTLSQSGLTSAPSASSGFVYLDNNAGGIVSFGNNLSNVVIGNAGDGTALETLTLTFDQAITGLSFQFVTFPVTPNAPLELNVLTDTGLNTGRPGTQNPITGNGEGSFSFTSSAFNSISLSLNVVPFLAGDVGATVGDTFIVDNFVVVPSVLAVPEPGALALFAGVAMPFAWRLRRRR